jgi:hypothetical protein
MAAWIDGGRASYNAKCHAYSSKAFAGCRGVMLLQLQSAGDQDVLLGNHH